MDSLVKSKFFVPGSLIIIVGLSIYNVYIFWPPPVPEGQVVESTTVDPQVTEQALGYLVKARDVGKVAIHDNQVYIGFVKKPEPADLASMVKGAAQKYAEAIGREVFVHGTHEQQIASIGKPDFAEYCNVHAGVSSVLGSEGKMVTQATIIDGNC